MKSFYKLYIFLLFVCVVIFFIVVFKQDINISENVRSIPPTPEEITSTFKLYFADKDELVVENRSITTKDMIFENAIIEELVKGPRNKTLSATIPQHTRILSLETIEKVCYVNLSKEYIEDEKWQEFGEEIMIWSLVNSLTQLNYIRRVQILVEGEKIDFLNSDFTLNQPFSRSEGIVRKNNITHFTVVKEFLDSLKMERFDIAYSMLDDGSRARIGFQEFKGTMALYIKKLWDYEIVFFNTQKFSDKVILSLKYLKSNTHNEIYFYERWKLIEEEGQIKIVLEGNQKIGF